MPGCSGPPAGMAGSWVCAYAAVWASTLAAAAAVALGGGVLGALVRRTLALSLTGADNAPPTVGRMATLAAHNIPIAAWPLLLGLLVGQSDGRARRTADAVVLACVLVNTVPVGAALGAYGTQLIPFIPQLPVEWAGLAVGYGSWLIQRRRALSVQERLRWLALLSVVLLVAAALEIYAVPHR